MKERPIIFGSNMVRVILEGRKTMTRRVVNFDHIGNKYDASSDSYHRYGYDIVDLVKKITIHKPWDAEHILSMLKCPYGQVGDRLWVREIWRVGAWCEDRGEIAVDYKADNYARKEWLKVPEEQFKRLWIQSSDDAQEAGIATDEIGQYHWKSGESPCRWHPSIFMPRWVSRITLEITAIKVERLQEITRNDAISEGVIPLGGIIDSEPWCASLKDQEPMKYPETAFARLWDSINGKRYSWATNPWVWVISFKRIEVKP